MGGTALSLKVSAHGYPAVFFLPGQAVRKVKNEARIAILSRRADAYAAGTPHKNSGKPMEGTGCALPANLSSRSSLWRDYLVRVKGAHAWPRHLPRPGKAVGDEEASDEAVEMVENL